MKKTVYFLGAGATKAVCPKAPTNQDLVRNALKHCENKKDAEQINQLIKNIYHRESEELADNQIWNLLDYIIQQGKSASQQYNLEKILNIRLSLMKVIIQEFKKSLQEADTMIYDDFTRKITGSESAIISTNYDILIDNALRNKSYNYGAKLRSAITGIRKDESSGLVRPSFLQTPGGTWINQGRVPLLKIHGSLNWLYCPKCKEADITVGEKGVSYLTDSDCYCANRNCTEKYEPLLITPTMYKNYENRIIRKAWECAERELIEADNIVFVGYALKEEDYEIRCLLMKALLNRQGPYTKITVVEIEPTEKSERENNKEIKRKYDKLYKKVDFKPIGFKKYVAQL